MRYIGIIIYLGLCYLNADKIGRHKTIGFTKTFLWSLFLSPFFGYLIAEESGQRNPRGCKWCGNKYNEAEFCALCGKNEIGDIDPRFKSK